MLHQSALKYHNHIATSLSLSLYFFSITSVLFFYSDAFDSISLNTQENYYYKNTKWCSILVNKLFVFSFQLLWLINLQLFFVILIQLKFPNKSNMILIDFLQYAACCAYLYSFYIKFGINMHTIELNINNF